jgi:hypothetical protein
MRVYEPYIAKNIGELRDCIASMMLDSPKFVDTTGYFREKNLDNTFQGLRSSLDGLRTKLGDERYCKLIEISNQMRAYFEADPEDRTGDAIKGRDLILDMLDLLKARRTRPPG